MKEALLIKFLYDLGKKVATFNKNLIKLECINWQGQRYVSRSS